jgi:hypothetical protein
MGMIFTSKDGIEVKSNVSEVVLLLSFVSKRTLFESTICFDRHLSRKPGFGQLEIN